MGRDGGGTASTSKGKPSRSSKRKLSQGADVDTEEDIDEAGVSYFEAKTQKPPKADFSKLLQMAQKAAHNYKAIYKEEVLDANADAIKLAAQKWRPEYRMWHAELRARFNILFHGLGSKRNAINDFAEQALTDGGLVVINAFHSPVSAKQIILAAISALSGQPESDFRSKSVEALLDTVPKRNPSGRVYIIIHSLDAPSLRSTAEQDALSQLSACQNVHIAATVDHVNSAALFDARQRDVFRWVWHEVSTHESYWLETMAAPPVLADAAQHETKQSASVVLSMLTPSSRAVFKTFAEALLAEQLDDDDRIEGISYEHLFRLARERFLVSSDATLRTHLTEFKDHDLVKTRRGDGGVELLYIPLPPDELRALVAHLVEASAENAQ